MDENKTMMTVNEDTTDIITRTHDKLNTPQIYQ